MPELGHTFSVSAWVKFPALSTASDDYDYIISIGATGTRTMFSMARWADNTTGGAANTLYLHDGSTNYRTTEVLAAGSWIRSRGRWSAL